MKTAFLALAALGFVSAAFDLDGLPECAVPCIKAALPDVGCTISDTACLCTAAHQESLASNVSPCLIRECSADEQSQVLDAAGAACAAYSASLVVETPVQTPTGGGNTLWPTKKTAVTTPTTTPDAGYVVSTPAANGTASGTKTGSASGTETAGESATDSVTVPATTDSAASAAGPAVGALLVVFAAALAM